MLVTIYIPTKNRFELLKLAVESVLNQTYPEIELIIVDDASTDATNAYLSKLSTNDNRVKFLSNSQSKGACVARNMAIKLAQGHYVTGLDDDDEFEPFHIQSLVEYWQLLEKPHVNFSALYVQYKYRNNGEYSFSKKISSVDYADLYDANHVGNQLFSTKENYIKAGLFDETMPAWQDLEFFYRFLKINGPARLLDINSYIFDITPRNDRISHQNRERILQSFIKFTTKHNLINNADASFLCMTQVYSKYYGFKLEFDDFHLFKSVGFSKHFIWKLLKYTFRRGYLNK